jgi:hypothetical protein
MNASALRLPSPRPPIPVHGAVASAAHPPHDVVVGPGWYDSSRDLLGGLEVHEGWPADGSLGEWIEHCLRA